MNVTFPPKFQSLFESHRFKVFYGGRGGGKSWSIARAAVLDAYQHCHLWLCTREFQNSIKDSVYQILIDQIEDMELGPWFESTQQEIRCLLTGARFIFKGLHHNIQEIKSTEGVDRCWIEEAQNMSQESFDTLLPTIRRPGSEFWISFNPKDPVDAVYKLFIDDPRVRPFTAPTGSSVVKVNWDDNPWFPEVLEQQRLYDYHRDPAKYAWVWGGECRGLDELAIYKNVLVEGFDSPPINIPRETVRWRFGADWGFAKDPSTLIRSFVKDGVCYVDEEVYGMHIELDNIAAFWRQIPGADTHRVYADSARPETISHMRRQGFDCAPCTKYAGSVEEGISFLQNFSRIVVHPRCKRTAEEFRMYRWKVTKTTETIQRAPEDKNNHCMDALRYAYDEDINHKRRGLDIANETVDAFFQNGW